MRHTNRISMLDWLCILASVALVCFMILHIGSSFLEDPMSIQWYKSITLGMHQNDVERVLGAGVVIPPSEVPTHRGQRRDGQLGFVPAITGEVLIKYRFDECIIYIGYDSKREVVSKHIQDIYFF